MDELELRAGEARLRIATLGAECVAWRAGGRELLWVRDARYWDATAPLLFPVCGWTRQGQVRIGGTSYPLGPHGFSRHSRFRVAHLDVDHAQLVMRDTPETRALYPFAFDLLVDYRLSEDALEIVAQVRNRGRSPMPYAFGLHPGFRYDPSLPAHILFDRPEKGDVPVIAPGGLFSAERRPIPLDGRRLDLGSQTFGHEALCFVPAASRGLVLDQGQGGRLRVEYPDFSNLVLWSRPGAHVVCIEPWTGFGDPVDFTGDLYEKPGMSLLAPSAVGEHRATFTVLP